MVEELVVGLLLDELVVEVDGTLDDVVEVVVVVGLLYEVLVVPLDVLVVLEPPDELVVLEPLEDDLVEELVVGVVEELEVVVVEGLLCEELVVSLDVLEPPDELVVVDPLDVVFELSPLDDDDLLESEEVVDEVVGTLFDELEADEVVEPPDVLEVLEPPDELVVVEPLFEVVVEDDYLTLVSLSTEFDDDVVVVGIVKTDNITSVVSVVVSVEDLSLEIDEDDVSVDVVVGTVKTDNKTLVVEVSSCSLEVVLVVVDSEDTTGVTVTYSVEATVATVSLVIVYSELSVLSITVD